MAERIPNFFTDSYDLIAYDSQKIEIEIFKHLEKGEYDKLKDTLQRLLSYKAMVDLYLEENEEKINQERNLSTYYAGYITALFQLGSRFTRGQWEEDQLRKIRTKYFEKILKILLENPYLRHKELAARLGVSPSGLNRIISEIESCPIHVINKEKNSKYTIYSLNSRGKQYARKLFTRSEIAEPPKQDIVFSLLRSKPTEQIAYQGIEPISLNSERPLQFKIPEPYEWKKKNNYQKDVVNNYI